MEKENNDKDVYITSDMYLFSYLRALEYEYIDLKWKDNRVWFYFKRDEYLEDHINNYFNGKKVMMSPREFINAIKDAKALTHQFTNQNKHNDRT
jgi:hypothetical protein